MKREYWPGDCWQRGVPQEHGMDPVKLNAMDKEIMKGYKNLHALLIVKKGYIVHERYFNNTGPDTFHNVASVVKSVISTLIGIAIDRGLIKSVYEKVLSFFPEYKTAPGDYQKRSLTIKDLLIMTAPIALGRGPGGIEPLNRLRRQRDWVRYILDIPEKKGRRGEFCYTSTGSHLLSAILTKASGLTAREFGNRYLFSPVGMREIPSASMDSFSPEDVFGKGVSGWIHDPQGISTGGWGMTLMAEDMARFGYLWLNRGLWNGKQIVSREWVEQATEPNDHGYGYNWWLKGEGENYSWSAAGSGGSLITCFPEKDLVVVMASGIKMRPRDRGVLFEDFILPSVIS